MTATEATEKCRILEKLNLDIWHAASSNEKNSLKDQFRSTWHSIVESGFKVIRGKQYDPVLGYRVPKFKIRNDNTAGLVDIIDNRGSGNHHGDCTTRCISFCTGVDYETIQKEQFANLAKAKESYYGRLSWRSQRVWEKSLTTRGFTEVVLPRHVTAKVFLRKFKDCGIDEGIIAARSSHHIAAIDMKSKKILDLWNSAGCRLISIFVPVWQKKEWMRKIRDVL